MVGFNATVILPGTFQPNWQSNCQLWLMPSVGIHLNGSTVSQWDDKSGNGRNAIQATGANQPTFSKTGMNGTPQLTFNGTSDLMEITIPGTLFTGNNPWSFYLVQTKGGDVGGGNVTPIFFGSSTSGDSWASFGWYDAPPFDASIQRNGNGGADFDIAAEALTDPNPRVFAGIYDGTNLILRDNGVQIQSIVASNTNGDAFASNQIVLGSITDGLGGGSFYVGSIGSVVAFSDATIRPQLEQQMLASVGLSAKSSIAFDPTQISGCVFWVRADLGVTLNSGHVSAWADQSGNTHNVFQSNAGAQPLHNTSDASYNNQSTLSFASASGQVMLSNPAWTLSQPATIIVVGNMDSADTGQAFTDWTSTELALYNASSHTDISAYAGGSVSGTITSTATPAVYAAIYHTTTSSIYQNNSQTALATGNVGTNNGVGQMSIGALIGSVDFLNGKIAEIITYSGALNATQMKKVFQYLGNRYGIAVS